ncbi:MAG: protein-L-isoaspartate O-methyltransferase [Pseudomonadota bacterium]
MPGFENARRAMVDTQVRPSDVTRYPIIEAMLAVPRERFVPASRREIAYAETDVPLAPGRALLAPRTLAKMLEAATIDPADLVLDLAPATGYSTALIARMAEAVVAIEPDADLCATAQARLDELEVMNAAISPGAVEDGDPDHGPYDVILVNGAVEQVPAELTAQLKDGGRLVAIFLDGPVGRCRVVTRAGDALSDRRAFDVDAPLIEGFRKARAFEF